MELEGRTEDKGIMLKAPTPDTGLIDICRDTCSGRLKLHLWKRKSDGSKGKVLSLISYLVCLFRFSDNDSDKQLVSAPGPWPQWPKA